MGAKGIRVLLFASALTLGRVLSIAESESTNLNQLNEMVKVPETVPLMAPARPPTRSKAFLTGKAQYIVPARSVILPKKSIWREPVNLKTITQAEPKPLPPEKKEIPKKVAIAPKPPPPPPGPPKPAIKKVRRPQPISSEIAIILQNGAFYPSKILLRPDTAATLIFATVHDKPAALIIEKMNLQRWIAKTEDPAVSQAFEQQRWELTREIAKNKVTRVSIEPSRGTYQFHDALSGALGEIVVE